MCEHRVPGWCAWTLQPWRAAGQLASGRLGPDAPAASTPVELWSGDRAVGLLQRLDHWGFTTGQGPLEPLGLPKASCAASLRATSEILTATTWGAVFRLLCLTFTSINKRLKGHRRLRRAERCKEESLVLQFKHLLLQIHQTTYGKGP